MRNLIHVEAELLRAEQVAEVLAVARSTVFELLRTGELPAVRIGRAVRVPRKALDRWIEEQTDVRRARSWPHDRIA